MSFQSIAQPTSTNPDSAYLASSCLDFLLIELVPLAFRVTNDLEPEPSPANDSTASTTGSSPQVGGSATTGEASASSGPAKSGLGSGLGAGIVGAGGAVKKMDEDEEKDAVFYRLESLGYRVGQGLVERFSKDRPRFNDTLDVIKFLCKDLWMLAFRKQIDNLKTNHRGVYVLTDNNFRPLSRMSAEAGGQAVLRAQPFLWFPCGIVRGALAAMGIDATVSADTSELPTAIFQVKTLTTKQ
ncbi:Trafficking protein particle complex subunit 6B [Ceratocystis lukuohia]|uniref:Trafficking protein particle complex subunit 6B n=2 Tax=Ceratocystis TaxID=5157 RepID=A0A2C5WUM9_9PEZI|nr:Trafficking protein particle complex subunit 6B [Ceratocystis fimbriata CBS 114723]